MLMVAALVAGATLIAPGTAANAAACNWGATRPFKYTDTFGNSAARGQGYSTNCPGGSFSAALQHNRAWGWSPLDNRTWGGNATVYVQKDCDNQSNYEYRVETGARNNGGGWTYRTSATNRFVC
jgi:hypothetical protein